MCVSERLDELARALATPMPRRRALRLFGATFAGMWLTGFRPPRALADRCSGQKICVPGNENCFPTCCPAGRLCCAGPPNPSSPSGCVTNPHCCDPCDPAQSQCLGDGSCGPGPIASSCRCPAGQVKCGKTCCCPAGQVKCGKTCCRKDDQVCAEIRLSKRRPLLPKQCLRRCRSIERTCPGNLLSGRCCPRDQECCDGECCDYGEVCVTGKRDDGTNWKICWRKCKSNETRCGLLCCRKTRMETLPNGTKRCRCVA